MIRRPAAIFRDNSGATLVEFAMASPALIMFIFAVLQIGLVMQANSALREVIGNAGRDAMVSYQDTSDGVLTDDDVEDLVRDEASDAGHRLDADELTVNATITDDNVLLVKKLQINLSYDLELAIPLWDVRPITLSESRTFYLPM